MKKILIIEDEESIRGFLKINLKRNGYEVIEADNGELGVKLALKEKPAIIILDVMLPGIDGFKVCKIIRNEDEKDKVNKIKMVLRGYKDYKKGIKGKLK